MVKMAKVIAKMSECTMEAKKFKHVQREKWYPESPGHTISRKYIDINV